MVRPPGAIRARGRAGARGGAGRAPARGANTFGGGARAKCEKKHPFTGAD